MLLKKIVFFFFPDYRTRKANAGKKAITSKYMMQELNMIILKYRVILHIT